MRHTRSIITFCYIFVLSYSVSGQIEVKLSIENESISGTDYFFDIYLQRISPAVNGNLYLGNADFVIAYNQSMFSQDTISKAGNPSPGFCTLLPKTQTPINILVTQDSYFTNTSTSIQDGNLIINLNGPAPSDTSTFNGRVACVDDQSATHRLGRFKITNIVDPGSEANLRWKTVGQGLKTMVFSLDTLMPFNSNQIILHTDTNTCPDELQLLDNSIHEGTHQAAQNLSASGEILAPSSVIFRAGQSIELIPEFSVNQGSILQITIGGCQ